ncbi:TPA: hypothetical protein NJ322_005013 [Vibrio parahaemolyticus]|nr:hypothetical protein [Vibrio parahaemolyticus]HCG7105657.1 hypothetical protein [Vibrio parahaemolyticus]
MAQEIVLEFSNVLNLHGKDGSDGTDGVSIVDLRKDGDDVYFVLSDASEIGPVTLPAGPAGDDGNDGTAGIGIKAALVNGSNHLILTLDNDVQIDAGLIATVAGTDGDNGQDGVDGLGIKSVVLNNDNTFTITYTDDSTSITDPLSVSGGGAASDEIGSLKFYTRTGEYPGYLLCQGGKIESASYTELRDSRALSEVQIGDPTRYSTVMNYTKSELLTNNILKFIQFGSETLALTDGVNGEFFKFSAIDDAWVAGQTGHQIKSVNGRAHVAVQADRFSFVSVNGDLVTYKTDDTVSTVNLTTDAILSAAATLMPSGKMYASVMLENRAVKSFESTDHVAFPEISDYAASPDETELFGVFEFDGSRFLITESSMTKDDGSTFNSAWGLNSVMNVQLENGVLYVFCSSSIQTFYSETEQESDLLDVVSHAFAYKVPIRIDEHNSIWIKEANNTENWAGHILSATANFYDVDGTIINIDGDTLNVVSPDLATAEQLILPNIYIDGVKAYIKATNE